MTGLRGFDARARGGRATHMKSSALNSGGSQTYRVCIIRVGLDGVDGDLELGQPSRRRINGTGEACALER
jgi:hypothetical protein